jgi:hypothetical protein
MATPKEIRDWGRDNGWPVGTRGRLSQELQDAYYKSHKPPAKKKDSGLVLTPTGIKPKRKRRPKCPPEYDNEFRIDGPVELDWTITTSMTHNRREIHAGTELSIKGVRGRYRFIRHIAKPDGTEWIDVWGGPAHYESWRSFRPEQIRTVHRINKTDKNVLAERKAAKAA